MSEREGYRWPVRTLFCWEVGICPDVHTACHGQCAGGPVFGQDPQITTLLQPWKIPAKNTPADAFADLEAVVRAYPPGLHRKMQEISGNAFQYCATCHFGVQDKYM